MPQYTLKMIEAFENKFDITVVEVNNYGNDYTVQRDKLKSLIQLNGNGKGLLKVIKENNPQIIHFQEVPESFLTEAVLPSIYSPGRDYNVVVTSHSSLTRRRDFSYLPDKIVAVSNWQKELFKKEFPDTDIDLWEYPIEDKSVERFDYSCYDCESGMARARKKLGFKEYDYRLPNSGKHILNVGLFTPGKNQGELFEIARKNPQNTYHFVGNQAPNFRHYWEPLMKNKPDNCIIWGERSDVDDFYKACDEMYFTSNFELNPICVKEALSYGLPVKMKRLETYGTDYDDNKLVTYI